MSHPEEERRRPLTQEQLDWIAECTRRSVNGALRRFSLLATTGFLILLAGNLFVYRDAQTLNGASRDSIVQSGTTVAVDGCNRDYETIQSLRQVLMDARSFQKAALKSGTITQSQYDKARVYYASQIARLKLPDCRKAKTMLNDDPERKADVPTPKFPTDE